MAVSFKLVPVSAPVAAAVETSDVVLLRLCVAFGQPTLEARLEGDQKVAWESIAHIASDGVLVTEAIMNKDLQRVFPLDSDGAIRTFPT